MNPQVKLLNCTQDPEFWIVRAARECTGTENKIDSKWVYTEEGQQLFSGKFTVGAPLVKVKLGPDDEALLRKLMKNQHNSTLGFASATIQVSDISLVCSHQLVRISHFRVLQKSNRYTEAIDEFNLPDSILEDNFFTGEIKNLFQKSQQLYNDMISKGIKKEDARYILPQASKTKLVMTSNFQGWKHFLHLRLQKKVQEETRLVAIKIAEELYKVAPVVFEEDFERIEGIR